MTGIRPLRRAVACIVVLALCGVGTAYAARGDPREKLNAEDNARANTIVLRKSDLGPEFKSSPAGRRDGGPYCRGLDMSDLVLTGKAVSPDYAVGLTALASKSDIYESASDANAAWRRLTSAAGDTCTRLAIQRDLRGPGVRLISYGRTSLPHFAQRSSARRVVWKSGTVRVVSVLVFMQRSRAIAGITFASAAGPVPRSEVVRVARIVAARMVTAMRGA